MATEIGWAGHAPQVIVSNLRPAEKDVYRMMWEKPEYREVAPGEYCALEFLKQSKMPFNSEVLDLGCGTGRGSVLLAEAGMNVTMVDFAENCLDKEIVPLLETRKHQLRFVVADLADPEKEIPVSAPYGFCTDVLEHIPPKDVDRVLNQCLRACQHVFFQISTVDDNCGTLIGHPLHLSVHPFEWWLQKFNERECVIHWSRNDGDSCMFYVSGWITGAEVAAGGLLNTEIEEIKTHVKKNISDGWNQVEPHETNNLELMIVGGGPSLKNQWEDIKEKRSRGMALIALNGAYGECLKNGVTPSGVMVVDARPFNERFVKPVIDNCKYFIASQCDPKVFEGLPKERTYIWHTMTDDIKELLNEQYERWYGIPGGSTVLLRAFPMFRMLGFKKYHVYGCDSCLMDGEHHSFSQPENDSKIVMRVRCGNRIFLCHSWMISQAHEFIDTIKFLGDEIEIEVYGDGLLKHILETGAELFDAEEAAKAA